MTEQKITEYCKKVVHSTVEDAKKYIFVGGYHSHSKNGGYALQWLSACKSKLCTEHLAVAIFFFMLLELRVVPMTEKTYPRLPLLSMQGLWQLH